LRTLDKSGEASVMAPASDHGAAASPLAEDVEARAARLGISEERVLEEYRRIGFSDISRILAWDAEGNLTAKASTELAPDDAPAIAEIVASASTGKIYRIKMHDKKPVLDAMARYLGMLAAPRQAPDEDDERLDDADDPREFLIRELDQLDREAAQRAAADAEPGPAAPDHPEV
jgi:hypothetical protein